MRQDVLTEIRRVLPDLPDKAINTLGVFEARGVLLAHRWGWFVDRINSTWTFTHPLTKRQLRVSHIGLSGLVDRHFT